MVSLEAETDRHGGVSLVEGRVVNDGPDPRRVTVASEMIPVLPPRREGMPEAGWDREEGRLTLVVAPGDRVGFGFASPAPPADPPVTVVECERAVADGGIDSPAGVVRALGDPSPPRDALPVPTGPIIGGADDGENRGSGPATDRDETREEAGRSGVDPKRSPPGDPPSKDRLPEAVGEDLPAVAAWFAAVERRIDCAGGEREDTDDPDRLQADARRLRAVSRRADVLADRATRIAPGEGDPDVQTSGEDRG